MNQDIIKKTQFEKIAAYPLLLAVMNRVKVLKQEHANSFVGDVKDAIDLALFKWADPGSNIYDDYTYAVEIAALGVVLAQKRGRPMPE